jgi:DNA polymerase-4
VLADRPVTLLPGVGPVQARRLAGLGITRIGQLQRLSDAEAAHRLGEDGALLVRRARGLDERPVDPARETKSVSAETTFDRDLDGLVELERPLWSLSEKLARRLRAQSLAAGGVVLKLKTARFVSRTRSLRLASPTVLPDRLFEAAQGLLAGEVGGTAFRLIGIGASPLVAGDLADHGDLADALTPKRAAAQAAIDALRARFGEAAVRRGRLLD